MKVDFQMARRFLSELAPGVGAFTYQLFSDRVELKKRDPATGKFVDPNARIIVQSFEEALVQLANQNARGVGVFVTVNATIGKGRKLANFDKARALFADLDGAPMPKWPIAPTMIVESSTGKFHVYWCLDGDMPVETWRGCMGRIVEKYGADKAAADPVRVLRLPGFYHCKGDPVMVEIVKCGGRRYTAAQLVKAFPPIMPKARKRSARSVGAQREVDLGELRSALEHLAATAHPRLRHGGTYADDYDTWMRFGLAIKRDLGDEGFEIWDEWSRFADRYPGEEVTRAKWDNDLDVTTRGGRDVVHIGTIFHTAKLKGWSFNRYRMNTALEAGRRVYSQHRGQA